MEIISFILLCILFVYPLTLFWVARRVKRLISAGTWNWTERIEYKILKKDASLREICFLLNLLFLATTISFAGIEWSELFADGFILLLLSGLMCAFYVHSTDFIFGTASSRVVEGICKEMHDATIKEVEQDAEIIVLRLMWEGMTAMIMCIVSVFGWCFFNILGLLY